MAKKGNSSGPWRPVFEVVSGLIAAVPIGIWLYFVSILVWAELVTIVAAPVALIPHVGGRIVGWMNFSFSVIPILVAGAVATEVWFCRVIIRRHHPVFAYTQAILGLAVSSPFFFWTAVHQKPLLPFWGQ